MPNTVGEKTMNVKSMIVMSVVVAAVAFAACRREEYVPMKLGADVPAQQQVAR